MKLLLEVAGGVVLGNLLTLAGIGSALVFAARALGAGEKVRQWLGS